MAAVVALEPASPILAGNLHLYLAQGELAPPHFVLHCMSQQLAILLQNDFRCWNEEQFSRT